LPGKAYGPLQREKGPYVDSCNCLFVVGARNQINIMYNFMEKR